MLAPRPGNPCGVKVVDKRATGPTKNLARGRRLSVPAFGVHPRRLRGNRASAPQQQRCAHIRCEALQIFRARRHAHWHALKRADTTLRPTHCRKAKTSVASATPASPTVPHKYFGAHPSPLAHPRALESSSPGRADLLFRKASLESFRSFLGAAGRARSAARRRRRRCCVSRTCARMSVCIHVCARMSVCIHVYGHMHIAPHARGREVAPDDRGAAEGDPHALEPLAVLPRPKAPHLVAWGYAYAQWAAHTGNAHSPSRA